MKKLGIIGAMSVEVETLKSEMKNLTVTKKAGMEKKDNSAQKTEEDFPDEDAKPVNSKGKRKKKG